MMSPWLASGTVDDELAHRLEQHRARLGERLAEPDATPRS